MVLSALVCVLALAIAVEALPGSRRLARLDAIPPTRGLLPQVSIVFGARDEEAGVERAVRSHLAQAPTALEVIAVDDRSTDRTSRILARVAAEHAPLRVIRVDELPPRWLGKCHALQRGAAAASGEWLLFTDADVVMEPTALGRARRARPPDRGAACADAGTPLTFAGGHMVARAELNNVSQVSHCRDLVQLPVEA